MNYSEANIIRRFVVCAFFSILLLLGTRIYQDYGMSWDEPAQYRYGQTVIRYVTGQDNNLLTDWDRYHGPAFEIILAVAQTLFIKTNTEQEIYFLRHYLNYLLFIAGVWCFYLICLRRFRNWKIALLGSLMLVLSPRIFGQAFYNSKDLPFLSFFIISVYTMMRYLDGKKILWAALHALACALLVDTRVLGIMVPIITVALFVKDIWVNRGERTFKIIAGFAVYGGLLIGLVLLFWPILWSGPIREFGNAFMQMSRFPWKGQVLYRGALIKGAELPWHYTPVWILISTPLIYIVLFTVGLVNIFQKALTAPAQFISERQLDAVALIWLALPLLALVLFRSVVYGAWRHSYFVYPALLLITVVGLDALYKWVVRRRKKMHAYFGLGILGVGIALGLIPTAQFMIKFHPYQDVYFNSLAGGITGARFKYDMDYWGLSYRKGLEYILKHDLSPVITLYVEAAPGRVNELILNEKERKRLKYVDTPEEAMYFLGAYRHRTQEYPYDKQVYTAKVQQVPILAVCRLGRTQQERGK